MVSAVSTGTAGLSAAFQRFDRAATEVASSAATADPTKAVVDVVTAKFDVAVNTAVLKSSIEAEKRVLDILV